MILSESVNKRGFHSKLAKSVNIIKSDDSILIHISVVCIKYVQSLTNRYSLKLIAIRLKDLGV